MVSILTFGPSLDVTYEVGTLRPDTKEHARFTCYHAGGNGINVHRGLNRLGVGAENFCALAGEIGAMVRRIAESEVGRLHAFPAEGETRISSTIILPGDDKCPGPQCQYEVIGTGAGLSPRTLNAMTEAYLKSCARGGFAVLTGSVPAGVPDTIYADLIRQMRPHGTRAIVDARGSLLQKALAEKPCLIKPNRHELEMLCDRPLPRFSDILREARALQKAGVTYVCVSLGGDGALLCGPEGAYAGKPPKVAIRSTVGAGDSMVAGLIAGLRQQSGSEEMLRLGLACGTGTAMMAGTELFDAAALPDLARQTEIKRL